MNFNDTADTAATITRANNGWIANSCRYGPSYVATSLHELATLVEGPAPVKEQDPFFSLPAAPTYISYAEGLGISDLFLVKSLAKQGRKIDAIKHLRNCFTTRMNLKEAKELVEVLCE
jgi:ribosomal protein L7/L12